LSLSGASADASLARRWYDTHGPACAQEFEGDWVFAAWDADARRLVLSRDPYGNSAWFYHRAGDLIAFSNHLPTLVSLVRPSDVDHLFVAGQLTAFNGFPEGRTAYREISRLLPAHTLTATIDRQQLVRYWRLEDTPVAEPTRPDALCDAFGAALQQAVRVRVGDAQRPASTLSAGLDSSAVTALAADLLRSDGRRLLALTSMPLAEYRGRVGAGSPGDESVLARETARRFDNVDHVCFDAAETSPLDGIRRMLSIQGQPGIAAANYFWIVRLLDLARAAGVDTVLTAQMGNGVWSWSGRPPTWYAPLSLGWRTGLMSIASRSMPGLASALRRFQQPAGPRPSGRPAWAAYSAILPELADAVALTDRMAEAGYDPSYRYRGRSDRQARLALLKPARSPIGGFWSHLGQAFRLSIVDPSQDKALLQCSWALPNHLWWQDQPRWVIRHVMAGRLPDVVRLHPGGHSQSVDLAYRLRAQTGELQEALSEMADSPLAAACVDISRCRRLVGQLAGSHPPSLLELKAVLMRGLDAGLFLAGVERRRWIAETAP